MATETQRSAFRSTSAWVPIGFAAAAIALLVGYLITGPHAPNIVVENGVSREDEGVAAHLWQLLMALQVMGIAAFAVLWLPRDPRRAVLMLGLQVVAMGLAALPVYLLEHAA
jgi:cyanate permease